MSDLPEGLAAFAPLREILGAAPGGGPTGVEVAIIAAITDLAPVRCTWDPGCSHSAVVWLVVQAGPFSRAGRRMVCVHHLDEAGRAGHRLFPLYGERR